MMFILNYLWHLWYSIDWYYVWNGISLALGAGFVWLLAVIGLILTKSLGGAGGGGVKFLFQLLVGWIFYERGENPNYVNITINTIHNGTLKVDTLCSDRPLNIVWNNVFLVQMIKRASRRTTVEDPLIQFPVKQPCSNRFIQLITKANIIENGKKIHISLQREDDYTALYGPLVGLASEKCNNSNALGMVLGHDVVEYKFVVALTFEKLRSKRARHFRAMVILEKELLNLPDTYPDVWREEHKTRFDTLKKLSIIYKEHPERFGYLYIWDKA